jgi:hypothetical protein
VNNQTDNADGAAVQAALPVVRERARPFREALYATPDESVRLVCEESAAGVIELRVFGPNTERASYTFNEAHVCEQFLATIEAKLLHSGFKRLATAERRRDPARL